LARRHYSSDGKTGEGKAEPAEEGAEEEPEPELTKLQAKDEEILDLTVRISRSSGNLIFIYDLHRAVYDTSKRTSSTCSATPREKKNNSATLP
jgi:hypothetical protein